MKLSELPAVDSVLKYTGITKLVDNYGHTAVRNTIRDLLQEIRIDLAEGNQKIKYSEKWFENECQLRLINAGKLSIRPVFNLTGTVLHTNLGRALLPPEALNAVESIISSPCNLEYDIESGSRGDRDFHIEGLICKLTGAEAATIVNNNAAAVVLVLSALAKNKEVIVSRGELIEIGGSFRLPEIMSQAGCILKEVGTTNRTHINDYRNSINENTALLMKVHTSNYRIEGFSSVVNESELVKLGKEKNIPVIVDLGSGSLVDLSKWGLPEEPIVQKCISDGVDIVTFSGDKLLGGPQSGFIAGRKDLVMKLKKHPLKRALRLDKIILSATAAVLNLYCYPEKIIERLPALRLLTRPLTDIESMANRLVPEFKKVFGDKADIKAVQCSSQIGSGALPVELLPSFGVAIKPPATEKHQGSFINKIVSAFSKLPIPVIGRVKDNTFFLDIRCLEDESTFASQLTNMDPGFLDEK